MTITTHFTCNWPAGKQNYHHKKDILHAMGLPANKIITVKTFPTHFTYKGPASKQNYHCETPISDAMGPPANKN